MNLSRLGGVALVVAAACGPQTSNVIPVTPTSAEMTPSSKRAEDPPSTPAASAPAAEMLAAGQVLTIRTVDRVSSDGSPGTTFNAVLVNGVMTNKGREAFLAGTKLTAHIVESRAGGSGKLPRITIALASLQGPRGRVELASDVSGVEGGRGGAAKNIGQLFSRGGAKVFLDSKTAIILPGTVVDFRLTQPARLD